MHDLSLTRNAPPNKVFPPGQSPFLLSGSFLSALLNPPSTEPYPCRSRDVWAVAPQLSPVTTQNSGPCFGHSGLSKWPHPSWWFLTSP